MKSTMDHLHNNEINLIIDSVRWQNPLLNYDQLVKEVVKITLNHELISEFVELNVRLTDDAVMQQLNKDFRQQDKPTNVLSFPADPEDEMSPFFTPDLLPLGDIALGYETLEREAKEQGKTFKDHFIHLLIHGLLHNLGFDHLTDEEAEEMEEREIQILKSLGINNPYIDSTT